MKITIINNKTNEKEIIKVSFWSLLKVIILINLSLMAIGIMLGAILEFFQLVSP